LSDNRSTRSGQSVESSLTNLTADFLLAPDAQGLFRSDMERQYLKLMDMIAAIVGTLDKREMFQSITKPFRSPARTIRGKAIAFRCARRRVDMGSGTAVWRCIYSRAERSLDQAL
jgi:hypothetical protein